MEINKTSQKNMFKSPSRMKYLFSIVLPLFFISLFVFLIYTINHNYATSGDDVIRQVVGQMLQKDPNSLDKQDFLQVTELDLSGQTIEDIRLLKEFKNLRTLNISNLNIPKAKTPVWKKVLIKMHVVDDPAKKVYYSKKDIPITYLNLRPLRNLSKLETLSINFTPIESIAALSGLKNLTKLNVFGTRVSDLSSIKKLKNLKTLSIGQAKISDLKPIKDLSKLHRLTIYDNDITDIEPIKNLSNLIYLDIRKCDSILQSQIDELQECLPELIIFDDRD